MPPATPPPLDRAAVLRFALASAAALLAAHLVDRWAYAHLASPGFAGTDLGRMLRVMGFLPLWIAAALALVLTDWPRRLTESLYAALARGALLLGGAVAGGLAAELLKLLFRRERPRAHGGEYVFRAWSERPFSTGGLALPSSHALVAFGALAMLARIFPRAWPVWYALGAGCAFSRVAAGAHFVSDVTLSAVAGVAVAEGLWRWHLRRTGLSLEAPAQTPSGSEHVRPDP
ncbi:MAG TPA: phosphatase PAP2 family protein [Longimicrobiaceae bacterium]